MLSLDSQTTSLPSGFAPYRFRELEMQGFGVKQLMLLSRAVSTGSWAPVIEALDSVLDIDASTLTDGDFYYLLACQRIQGYTISPLLAAWTCDGIIYRENGGLERVFTREQLQSLVAEYDSASEEEREQLEDPEKLVVTSARCGHTNEHTVSMADLICVYLDKKIKLPEGLDFPRVGTLVDAMVMRENPEQEYIVQAARWVAAGDTLDEKVDILSTQKDLRLFESALQTEMKVRHGVSQIITLPCSQCGQQSEHKFNIGPETFFDV